MEYTGVTWPKFSPATPEIKVVPHGDEVQLCVRDVSGNTQILQGKESTVKHIVHELMQAFTDGAQREWDNQAALNELVQKHAVVVGASLQAAWHNPRVQGGLKVAGGTLCMLGENPVSMMYGADLIATGTRELWTGRPTNTLLQQGLDKTGLPRETEMVFALGLGWVPSTNLGVLAGRSALAEIAADTRAIAAKTAGVKEGALNTFIQTNPSHPQFVPPKNWNGQKIKNPNGPGAGFPDKKGNVWVSTDHKGTHAPHWDVQHVDGTHTPIYP